VRSRDARPRQGSLADVSLPALLRGAVRSRKTGVLRVGNGVVNKTLYVSDGRIIFATLERP
jgi:hypothetical protein